MFETLTFGAIQEAQLTLESVGLKLPKIGWTIDLPDGRILARDNKGYYWVRDQKKR